MIFVIISILFAAYRLYNLNPDMDLEGNLICILIFMAIDLCVIVRRECTTRVLRKNWLSMFNLFLASFVCVHFQSFADLLVFGRVAGDFKKIYMDDPLVLKSAYICLLGLGTLVLGYLCADTQKKPHFSGKVPGYFKVSGKMYSIATIMQVVLVAVFFAVNGRMYLSRSYSQEMLNSMSGTINAYIGIFASDSILISILVKACLLSKMGKRVSFWEYCKSHNLLFYASWLFYLALILICGDRGPVISGACAFVFGYLLVSRKKISFAKLAVVLAAAAIVVSVLGISRRGTYEGEDIAARNAGYVDDLFSIQSVIPFTKELAGSNKTVLWAVESTPDMFPFRKGLFAANNILSIIPFSGRITAALGLSRAAELGHSPAFLDWYTQGNNVTYGVGTSTVADIYLDFGIIGVAVVLFLLGLLFRKVEISVLCRPAHKVPPFVLCTGIVLFSNAIYLPRAILLSMLRNIVWLYLLLLIFVLIDSLFERKAKKRISE